ncbi:hypothetical protein BSKO_06273 [Bryopsis sp. KO-2023]|nr:hypothetical protein BSKO_06273 [Bryopsis sp. KO-2023]
MVCSRVVVGLLLFSLLQVEALSGPAKAFKQTRKKWSHINFDDLRQKIAKETGDFVHLRGERTFAVPIEIDVILVGFAGDGAYKYEMDGVRLEDLLTQNYPTRRPVDRESGKPLSSEFDIIYNVFHSRADSVLKIEEAVKAAMVPAGKYRPDMSDKVWGFDGQETALFNVEATKVEAVFDELVYSAFMESSSNVANDWQTNMAIVLVNPSKRRMNPNPPQVDDRLKATEFDTKNWDSGVFDVEALNLEDGNYMYQYKYNGAGASQTWLARKSYIVIDVSAGPCKFGPEMTPSGAVSPVTLPRIQAILFEAATTLTLNHPQEMDSNRMETIKESRDAIFRGKIAGTLVSAIHHLILPDMWVKNVQDTRRLLVPFMLIRNHLDSNSLEAGDPHHVNISRIHEQLFGLMGSRSNAVVLHSHHSLHEHKPLAIALHKAMYSKSEAVVITVDTEHGKPGLHAKVNTYLDGNALVEEFEQAADVLTSGWVGSVKEDDQIIWGEGSEDEFNGKQTKKKKSLGTRIIPVYMLSLKSAPFDLVLDNGGLVVGDDRAVIALQTLSSFSGTDTGQVDTGHIAQGERVSFNTLDIERHVVAGLATSLMGIPPPYESYSAYKKDHVVMDWLWATGHTPFGPYSNTSTLSSMTFAVARRNMFLAQVETLLVRLKRTLRLLDDFVGEYLSPPFNELNIKHGNFGVSGETWIDQLYKSVPGERPPPLPKDVTDQAKRIIGNIEEKLINLASAFYDGDTNQVERMTATLRTLDVALYKHVYAHISSAREKLRCCAVAHKLPETTSRTTILLVGLMFLAICVWIALGVCWIREDNEPLLAVTNRMF